MALKSRLTIAACIALVPAWVTLASAQALPKNSTGENDVFAGERELAGIALSDQAR